MKIFLATATVILYSGSEYPWRCVVYAYNVADAKAKVNTYIRNCPHMKDVEHIVDIIAKEVAVIA